MLFAVRAVAILSGIATHLDEKFDPWQEIIPFAEKLAMQELATNSRKYLRDFLLMSQALLRLPVKLETLLKRVERGDVTVKTKLSAEHRNLLRRINRSINGLALTIFATGLLLAGVILGQQKENDGLTLFLGVVALALFLWSRKRD